MVSLSNYDCRFANVVTCKIWMLIQRLKTLVDRFGLGLHLVGQLGSGVPVSASFQILALRMHFTRSNIHTSAAAFGHWDMGNCSWVLYNSLSITFKEFSLRSGSLFSC